MAEHPFSKYDFNPERRKKVILSIDGGGMRGTITIAMLAELEKQTGKSVQEMFDMVGGTSTGAIIAAGIGLGMSAQEILDVVYKDRLPKGFQPRDIGFWLRFIFGGFRYFYPLGPFLEALRSLAEGKRVRDIKHPIILMVTKDLRTSNNYYVVNRGPGAEMFGDWPVTGAVAASGAAPIFFEPVAGNLVDGGVGVYGNPCLAVATEAMEYIGEAEGFVDGNVVHISLGTGFTPNEFKDGDANRFNILNWVEYMILEGIDDAAIQQVFVTRAIYGLRTDFRRYNPLLTEEAVREKLGVKLHLNLDPKHLSLDSHHANEIELMEAIGRAYAREIDWSQSGLMPWQTMGGHDKPALASVDWSKTPYR